MIKPSDMDIILADSKIYTFFDNNTKLYRLEINYKGKKVPFSPRIPLYLLDPHNRVDENDPYNDVYYEDNYTNRIPVSESIDGCLNALVTEYDKRDQKLYFSDTYLKFPFEMFVYTLEKPINDYKYKHNKDIIRDKDVYDANITKESWILENTNFVLCGRIAVYGINEVEDAYGINKKVDMKKFNFDWEWVEKW